MDRCVDVKILNALLANIYVTGEPGAHVMPMLDSHECMNACRVQIVSDFSPKLRYIQAVVVRLIPDKPSYAAVVSDKAGFITGDCVAVDGGRQCLGAR